MRGRSSITVEDLDAPPSTEQAARVLGRRGGKKGGSARAKKLTKQRRSEIARQAANARWARRETPP